MSDRFEEAVRQAAQGLSGDEELPLYHEAWARGRRRRLVKRGALGVAGAALVVAAIGIGAGGLRGPDPFETDDVATGLDVAAEATPTPGFVAPPATEVPTTGTTTDPSAVAGSTGSSGDATAGTEEVEATPEAPSQSQATSPVTPPAATATPVAPAATAVPTTPPAPPAPTPIVPTVTAVPTTPPAQPPPTEVPATVTEEAPAEPEPTPTEVPATITEEAPAEPEPTPTVGFEYRVAQPTATSVPSFVPEPTATSVPTTVPEPTATTAAAEPPETGEVPSAEEGITTGDEPGDTGEGETADESPPTANSPPPPPAGQRLDPTTLADAVIDPNAVLESDASPCDSTYDGTFDALCEILGPYSCVDQVQAIPGYTAIDTTGDGLLDTCEALNTTSCDIDGDLLADVPCIISLVASDQ